MNPLDEYMSEKHAGFGAFGNRLGQAAETGMATALATGAIAATGMAAHKIYEAVTKARDFRDMMGSPFNADLAEHHQTKPKEFNAAFTSLRRMNPTFSQDPMIAGTYMRQMMTYDPATAGGVLVEALGHRRNEQPSPLAEGFHAGGREGAKAQVTQGLRSQQEQKMFENSREHQVDMAHLQNALQGQREDVNAARRGEDQEALNAVQHDRGLKMTAFKEYLSHMGRDPQSGPQAIAHQKQESRIHRTAENPPGHFR